MECGNYLLDFLNSGNVQDLLFSLSLILLVNTSIFIDINVYPLWYNASMNGCVFLYFAQLHKCAESTDLVQNIYLGRR